MAIALVPAEQPRLQTVGWHRLKCVSCVTCTAAPPGALHPLVSSSCLSQSLRLCAIFAAQGYHTSEYRLRALAALSESSSGRQAIYEEAAKRAMNAQRETLLKNPLLDTVDENGVAQPNEDEKEDEDEEESEGFPEPEGLLTVKERFKWEMQRELFEFRKLKWYYKPMYILEFPFMMLRRFTVPMTSTGEYSRPFLCKCSVATSLGLY
eukprot:scaffold2229_cov413-Prasinococcus_capsulatus_cf.AAC.10